MKWIIIIFLFISTQYAVACSCVGKETPKQAKKRSDLVAVGKIIESKRVVFYTPDFIKDSIDFMDYTFVVKKKYKGKLLTDTLTIRTGFGHGDCGVNFTIGEEYIIYGIDAYKENMRRKYPYNATERDLQGVFETDICSRTNILKYAEKDLQKLK